MEKEEFSDSDRLRLEEIVKEREHRTWLWSLLRRWATWITAVIIGLGVVWDGIAKVLGHIRGLK